MTADQRGSKNLTTDNTDVTDLHRSKSSIGLLDFVNPCHPYSSVVRFAFLCRDVWVYSAFSAAAAGLVFALAAGLAAVSDARRARVLTRLAACERLRVFLRALVFGMESGSLIFRIEMVLSVSIHPTLWHCQNRRNCQKVKSGKPGSAALSPAEIVERETCIEPEGPWAGKMRVPERLKIEQVGAWPPERAHAAQCANRPLACRL